MNLDTFHNHADTMSSGFKALTEEDLDRIGRERSRAKRGRWAAIGGVSLLAFLGCLAGTGYASSVLTGGSALAKAPAPVHRVARSQSPGKTVKPAPVPAQTAPVQAPPGPAPAQAPAADPMPYYGANNQAYLAALANAGIVAPANWSLQAASNLESAWAAGETEDQTNAQYLTPGGIYPYHLATFNAIVHEYFG